jgi:hypothetical protein
MTAFKSPCIKVCSLHWGTGWCFGCGRTGAEIVNWLKFGEAERDAVLAALPARLAGLGLPASGNREEGQRRAREQRLAAASAPQS